MSKYTSIIKAIREASRQFAAKEHNNAGEELTNVGFMGEQAFAELIEQHQPGAMDRALVNMKKFSRFDNVLGELKIDVKSSPKWRNLNVPTEKIDPAIVYVHMFNSEFCWWAWGHELLKHPSRKDERFCWMGQCELGDFDSLLREAGLAT